ncbi:MAG TPA: YitT family protein [Candidatus Faecousia faecipullorum]|nr:YitT family protein [Candidatus Faecousia faecipullorum]
MRTTKKVWTYFAIGLLALIAAVNYELFVFPNQFAPAGLNGICTMIQYLSGISVGYLSLLINVPLALWCFFDVSRPLAIRSMVYVVTFSVGLLILENIDITAFAYSTENGTSKILGPMVAGVIQGFVYSVLVKASAYTGGTDFISAAIHKHHPDRPFFGMSFIINAAIAICSYFVYGYQMEPVILCILYTFMSTTVGDRLMKSGREAISFEIITDHPTEVSKELIEKLHHTTTMIPAKGMYKGKETSVLLCVVNKTQEASVTRIVRNYPHTFAIVHPVSEILGNFKHLDSDGKKVPEVLDSGDGQTL